MPVSNHRALGRGRLSPAGAAAVVVGSLAITAWSGQRFSPAPTHPRTRRWYRSLIKPYFTPPGVGFAAGWSTIELALAYGGYRLLRAPATPMRNAAIGLWTLNNALIAGWSAIFFGKKELGVSALTAAGMIGTAGAYAAAAARTDRKAALTALPLIGWLAFATLLAEEVWRRNDD